MLRRMNIALFRKKALEQLYYAQKEQLLTKIDHLIRELEQLRQIGQKKRIFAAANLLEKSLRELSALRQAKAVCNRRCKGGLRDDRK